MDHLKFYNPKKQFSWTQSHKEVLINMVRETQKTDEAFLHSLLKVNLMFL